MTRERKIKILKSRKEEAEVDGYVGFAEALGSAIESLEQESKSDILDKIRAEIEQTSETVDGFLMHDGTKRTILQILDKYKAESEE